MFEMILKSSKWTGVQAVPILRARAEAAIQAKHEALGGDSGPLGHSVECVGQCPDRTGYFRRFAGGMIYSHPKAGTHAVYGAILEKWASLGFETSVLGYPIEDEKPTPDGVGRFSRFQGGMIYWSEPTGAHEVHGAILERWQELGFERSWLGYPTSDEQPFPQDGRVSTFQNGSIYWWPDTGVIELREVVVHYTGLICFGETDWDQVSNDDEPYVLVGTVSPKGGGAVRSTVYTGVDAGESRPDLVEVYRGQPYGLTMTTVLMEHDEDDPNRYLEAIQGTARAAFEGIKLLIGLIPVAGPIIATVVSPFLGPLSGLVAGAVNSLLNLEDDWIGQADIVLSPKDMVVLAARVNNQNEKGVGFKLETPLFTGEGATYKVYFGIVPG